MKTITTNSHPIPIAFGEHFGVQAMREKSRRDGIFLTVGFNLRPKNDIHSSQSPIGTTLWIDNMPSLRDLLRRWALCFRRLKPTVNNYVVPAGLFAADTTLLAFLNKVKNQININQLKSNQYEKVSISILCRNHCIFRL